jgi:hypothetical protein
MLRRSSRRAAVLSLGVLLAFAGTASADTVFGDAITGTPEPDGARPLGDVAPGATVSADVRFLITCAGIQHVDANQSVVLTGAGGTAQLDGAIVSVSDVTLAPLTTPWSPDAQGCPDPVPSQDGGALSTVVMRAPTTVGTYTFTTMWTRSLTPEGGNDLNAFSRTPTSVNFTMRVVANTPPPNTPPVLTVPASFSVEGDTTGGWDSVWTVSATDAEDSPDPTPVCTPAAGPVLPVATTTVSCTVQDSAGAAVTKTFDVTVLDTTRPTLTELPGDISVTTSDPNGRIVTFDTPSANDVVDGSPTVVCAPDSGSHFDVGTTTVTCTATDDSGNSREGSFQVTVALVAPHTASAIWLEPVAGGDLTFVANRGRTIPVKVNILVDGRQSRTGDAVLSLTPCGGGTTINKSLEWSGGRWNVSLDTSSLSASCYTVTASIDGLTAGSFTLELRGDEAAKASPKRSAPLVLTRSSTDRPSKLGLTRPR